MARDQISFVFFCFVYVFGLFLFGLRVQLHLACGGHLIITDITAPHKQDLIIETPCKNVSSKLWLQKSTYFPSGCSSVTVQTRVSHLAAQIDPYSTFLASLIYMELWRTIIQSQVPGLSAPYAGHVAQHEKRKADYAPNG